MPMRSHKRKRNLRESPVDLTKMRMALYCLNALEEELDGIHETEAELYAIMEHFTALESILNSAKRQKMSFSVITKVELGKLGVIRKRLAFSSEKVTELASNMAPKAEAEVPQLRARILEIYEHVNMDFEPGSRMVLDAILLSLVKIASDVQSKTDVAIFPEMRLTPIDGVQVINPNSGYEVWLSGNVDYAVVQYEDISDHKDRLLGPGGSREDVSNIANGRLFLVEAKRQNADRSSLASYIPEAVSQAIALIKSTDLDEARFCLSDGKIWMFFILKFQEEKWIYYESAPRQLIREALVYSDASLREIVQLVLEWLKTPSTSGLYDFE